MACHQHPQLLKHKGTKGLTSTQSYRTGYSLSQVITYDRTASWYSRAHYLTYSKKLVDLIHLREGERRVTPKYAPSLSISLLQGDISFVTILSF